MHAVSALLHNASVCVQQQHVCVIPPKTMRSASQAYL